MKIIIIILIIILVFGCKEFKSKKNIEPEYFEKTLTHIEFKQPITVEKKNLDFELIEQTIETTFNIKIDKLKILPFDFKKNYHPLLDSTEIKTIKWLKGFKIIEFENSNISKVEFKKLKAVANKALKNKRALFDYHGIFHKSGVSYNQIDKWIIVHSLRCNMYPKDYKLDKLFTSNLEKLDNEVDWVKSYCGWGKIEVKNKLKKCDIDIVLSVSNNINEIDTLDVDNLFRTIDKTCINNAEFSEVSNEVLFKVIYRHPELFIYELHRLKDEIDLEYIIDEFESPINDSIKIDDIIKKIELLETENSTSDKLIEVLKRTLNKQ